MARECGLVYAAWSKVTYQHMSLLVMHYRSAGCQGESNLHTVTTQWTSKSGHLRWRLVEWL